MSSTFEKYQSQRFSETNAMEAYARGTFGLAPALLERHLRIMNDLQMQGRGISSADKRWLLDQAKAAGRDVSQAAQQIARVEAISEPKRRARAYIVASGAPSQELVEHAMELSKTYSTTWGSSLAEDRLAARDEKLKHDQFHFKDDDRTRHSREESGAVRRTIEAALQERGLIQPEARSLEEAQHRARGYANSAADRLESMGPDASRRDQIEAAWHADQAFQRLSDAGAGDTSVGDVNEQTDHKIFAARAIDG